MYAALWRSLPGPWPLRLVILLLLLTAVAWACVQWIFPWAATTLPVPDTPVTGGS